LFKLRALLPDSLRSLQPEKGRLLGLKGIARVFIGHGKGTAHHRSLIISLVFSQYFKMKTIKYILSLYYLSLLNTIKSGVL
jgi:hypothetical protein